MMSSTGEETDMDAMEITDHQNVNHGSALKYLKLAVDIANAPRPPLPANYLFLAAQRNRLLSSGEESDEEEESNFLEDDYEEPAWGVTEVEKETGTGTSIAEDFNRVREEQMAAQRKEEVAICQQIHDLLDRLEPAWDLGENGDPTVMYHKILENCTFLTDGGKFAEQPSLMEKCGEFHKLEEQLGNHEYWLRTIDGGEALILLERRCRTVRNCLRTARIVISEICNNIASGTHNSDYIIHTGKFKHYTVSTPVLKNLPPHLNDELFQTSIAVFDKFVKTTHHRNLNGICKKVKFDIKTAAVHELQTYIRQNLAVDSETFCLLTEECSKGEGSRRLSEHNIYWKLSNERGFEVIRWSRLLKSSEKGHENSLGIINMERRACKTLLNKVANGR